jgi:hypothetical protein
MNCAVCQQQAKADPRARVDEAVTMIDGTVYCDRHLPDPAQTDGEVTP